MFLKHLATPIKPLRDPLGGRDPQFEETWCRLPVVATTLNLQRLENTNNSRKCAVLAYKASSVL